MKEYRVISKVDPDTFELCLNKAAQEGFTVEQFKPVCTASGVVETKKSKNKNKK